MGSGREDATVCYVYGIVPADAELPEKLTGIGGGDVSPVRYGELAALVSGISPDEPLGTRDDLLAHERVVESMAADTTILPLRFGAVVASADAVVDEMLSPHHDWFAEAMEDFTGRSEFVVVATYVQDEVLREILEEDPEVERLRASLRDLPEDAGYYDRIRLGELVVRALDAKREEDGTALAEALAPYASAVAARQPTGEDDAADVAFLVAAEDRARFEKAVDDLGREWAGRIRMRLLGPRAPYDFVPTHAGPPDMEEV